MKKKKSNNDKISSTVANTKGSNLKAAPITKQAVDWNEEDRANALTYLASLVASTFDNDVSIEDVQRVLQEEDVASKKQNNNNKEKGNGAKGCDEGASVEGDDAEHDDSASTDSSMDSETSAEARSPSDFVLSPTWREKLKKGSNSKSATLLGDRSTDVERLPPLNRKWTCTRCQAEQEVADADRMIRSKGRVAKTLTVNEDALACAKCGFSALSSKKKKST